MEDQRKNALSVIEDLIEINNDGNHGYKTAAENIENPEYRSLFQSFAQQRAQFAAELEREAHQMGRDPDAGESISGSLHRGWINIKSAVTGGSSDAILGECETGDKAAVETYEKALADNDVRLPSNVENLVRNQHQAILEAYNRVKSFKRRES
jgi:uncharacterized protein (TIGR02284 family)